MAARILRSDGTKLEKLANAKASLRALAVDETHVYWAEADGLVWRVPK